MTGRATDYAELKCPELTWGMDTWCGCPEETVSPPACTVCGNGEISSDDPCRKFWLAETLHKPSVVGPNFGTCQYYDWIVERFTKTECTTTSSNFETTGILDGLDVQSFCCNDKEPEGTIQLCQDPNATNLEHLLVPVLDVTCSDIAGQTMYLVNETVLIEPWEDLAGRSLREHCCNNHGDGLETSTTTSSTSTAIKEDTCVGLEHLRRQH